MKAKKILKWGVRILAVSLVTTNVGSYLYSLDQIQRETQMRKEPAFNLKQDPNASRKKALEYLNSYSLNTPLEKVFLYGKKCAAENYLEDKYLGLF